jgi:hypothetical protein
MTNRLLARLFLVAVLATLCFACAPPAEKDFFECGPNNALVVCDPGETPNGDWDCRNVGSGQTTRESGDCS